MKKCLVYVLLAGVVQTSYALVWHNSVLSLWPSAPVQIDGRATEWSEYPIQEVHGIGFRAMNDGSNLYLLIRGTDSDGRNLLAGLFKQNVTLWFLKADRKTNDWGINLDFSRAQEPAPGVPPTLASFGMEPVRVVPQGLEVSTTTFPDGFQFQADLSSQLGRQPIYEVQIPLQMIEHRGRMIYFDLVTSPVSADVRAALQPSKRDQEPPSQRTSSGSVGGTPSGGGHHHHGGGSSGGGTSSSSVQIPLPIHLSFEVSLAKEPKH